MITTPGGGSCEAVGKNPACEAPEKAAYSATFAELLTTPTPPTANPFLNNGTPPGFTAVWFLAAGIKRSFAALAESAQSPINRLAIFGCFKAWVLDQVLVFMSRTAGDMDNKQR